MGLKPGFVRHFPALFDIVAEIDIRQVHRFASVYQIDDHETAQRPFGLVWLEKAVDRAQPVTLLIHQNTAHQAIVLVQIFGQACLYRAVQDHG